LLRRLIHAQERQRSQRDTNRIVRPFEWGASFITDHANGDDPRQLFREHARDVLQHSELFYALPHITDYKLDLDRLTWTSAVTTPTPENNIVRARYFPAPLKQKTGRQRRDAQSTSHASPPIRDSAQETRARSAVLILPQWNADSESHVELCRVLNRLGLSALRLTLPYHEDRRPPELERADYLVSSNIGRTIQSVRQAVLDARAAITWLVEHEGYERIGIVGTSIGSCTAFLAWVHDTRIDVGVFNHVSGYFADVAWRGISTQHVRAGFGDEVTLEELREFWSPISPFPYINRLAEMPPRPMRFIAARYDLTFPLDLSREVIEEVRRRGIPLNVAWLPCGHYTSGEKPWVYLDGWKIASFLRKHLSK
jgi:dienelactone hydrolase